jgi:hypothetical protein
MSEQKDSGDGGWQEQQKQVQRQNDPAAPKVNPFRDLGDGGGKANSS